MSAPISNDLVAIVGNMPNYMPNMNKEDRVEWDLTPNKQFTIKSAWNALRTPRPVVS